MNDRTRRRAVVTLLATLAASALLALLPGSAVACSCAMPGSMAETARDPDTVIFSGTILPSGRPAVDVAVDHWFKSGGGATTTLAADGFNDRGGGADCRVPYPAAGSSWIYVAYLLPDTGAQLHTNLCSPQGRLDTPEGQAMLADAISVFGEGVSPSPSTLPSSGPLDPIGTIVGDIAPIIGAVAVVGIVFAGLALLLRRRDGEA